VNACLGIYYKIRDHSLIQKCRETTIYTVARALFIGAIIALTTSLAGFTLYKAAPVFRALINPGVEIFIVAFAIAAILATIALIKVSLGSCLSHVHDKANSILKKS
jgi:hypothetical protein